MIKKLINQAIGLNLLRKALGQAVFAKAAHADLRLKILDQPQDFLAPKNRHLKVLVLSPHEDDDVFGAGGAIAKHAKSGEEISILYLCDGSKGTPQGIRDSSLITRRKNEAERAAKILGVEELIFWGYKDGTLTANSTSIKALKSLILEKKPDLLYLPSFLDNHPDHLETNKILYHVLSSFKEDSPFSLPAIALYELWTPLIPNRLLDITAVIDLKKPAIKTHQSQLKSRQYDEAILGLNSYRAKMNGIKGYAEAFFVIPAEVYKKLFSLIYK